MAVPTQHIENKTQSDVFPVTREAAQLELELLKSQQAELEAQKLAIKQASDKKHQFLADRAQIASRIARTLEEINSEIDILRAEAYDLEEIQSHFKKNLSTLNEINPDTLTKGTTAFNVDSSYVTLQRIDKDFGDAVTFCTQKHQYSKTLKKNRQYGTPLSIPQLKETALQGLAYNLPLIILGLIVILLLLIKF